MEPDITPLMGLGKLESLNRRLTAWNCTARDYCLAVFAADHECSRHHTSQYQAMNSSRIADRHLRGLSPTLRLLQRLGKKEYLIDVGLAGKVSLDESGSETAPTRSRQEIEYISVPVRAGSRDFINQDSLNGNEVAEALKRGREICDIITNLGFDIIGVGEIGIGNTLAAAALACALTGMEPARIVGRGSSSDKVITKKIDIIVGALNYRKPSADSPVDLLTRFGGLEIAALAGFISRSAEMNIPVVLDGYVTSVAALLAAMDNPVVRDWLVAPSLSDQNGHGLLLKRLGLEPLFDLDLNFGEGLGAVIGLFLAEMARRFHE